ncbi:hypothetical protein SCP_1005280 [Sparassis crispa]|uniref:Uncharacterized protein n=1 Tax=Sparassis crispa TaxID=139825 RepID=A0A401GYQ1_9APHY|nr:hypothetical protein SCP_1005280 [Sparassis crispa]GBE87281.1 hypothetical protein SCP_1005280 [Sparassis crispa]
MRASTAIPTIWDTLHIATTSFELPVSSDVLYLVSHGSLSFASGSVQITDEGSAGSDVADVEITAFFDHEHEFALTRVCALTACGGGERRRYIRKHPLLLAGGTIKFDSRSRLSCPPHPSPLFINKFETHLPWFAHHVGDLKDSVYFGRVSLRSAFIGYDVSSLFGEHIDVTTTLSAIKGSFNPSSYLTLHTSNAPISVQVGMLNDPEGNHTVVEIHTSNGPIKANMDLLSAASSGTGGNFSVDARTPQSTQCCACRAHVELARTRSPAPNVRGRIRACVVVPVHACRRPQHGRGGPRGVRTRAPAHIVILQSLGIATQGNLSTLDLNFINPTALPKQYIDLLPSQAEWDAQRNVHVLNGRPLLIRPDQHIDHPSGDYEAGLPHNVGGLVLSHIADSGIPISYPGERPDAPWNPPVQDPVPQPILAPIISDYIPPMATVTMDEGRHHVSQKELGFRKPEIFNGSDHSKLREFINQCKNYMAGNSHVYQEDNQKIAFVLSHMQGGTAGSWAQSFIETELTNDDFLSYGSWRDFIASVNKAFGDENIEETARTLLRNIKQGTRTADDYIAEFRSLESKAKLEDAGNIEYFKWGLNDPLRQRIYGMESMPKTLDKWYEYTSRFDNQWRSAQIFKRGTTTTTRGKGRSVHRPYYSASAKDPNAMDVDRVSISRLSPDERQKRMKEGLCFLCGKKGHIANDRQFHPQSGSFTRARTIQPGLDTDTITWIKKMREDLAQKKETSKEETREEQIAYVRNVFNDMTDEERTQLEKEDVTTEALIDSGAAETFMNIHFAEENDFIRWELPKPITVMNADGTPNQMGTITHCTWKMMKIGGRKTLTRFLLTGIGKENILLGMPWLKRLNPMINWETGDFWFGKDAKWPPKPTVEDAPDEEVSIFKEDGLPELITTETSPTSFRHSESIREITADNTERGELPAVRNDTEPDDPPSETPMDQLDDDDLVISYIAGEPVIGIFEPIRKESPLTNEETETTVFTIRRGPAIGRMTHSTRSPLFCNAQNTVFYKPSGKSQELAQQAHKEASAVDKPKTVEELVPNYLHDLKSVFEKKAAERFPETRPWDHAIDLKPDFIPHDCKVYPLSLKEQGAMDDFLEENLRKGYIRPSKSPMASPFFFVGKKDGALRPCQDYRYLNEGTVKNAYPLPLISDLMDQFKGASIFTKMDLRSGYNNVRIKDGDQWKGAFKTNRGLFEPMVMFFGLCNSPATFQMMMNALFKDMIDEGWIVIYMDDILIFSNDLEEHHVRTRHVLQRLKDSDLFLKPEKCFFDVKEVEFLGMIIRENYIGMDPIKLKGIAEWPEPTTVKGVRSFLGFGNFYRKFIANFSDIAKPLTNLTRTVAGSPPFEWTTECQTAFDTLKQRFSTAPVLLLPDKAKPFIVESDASKFATGAVLRQADINGDLHPCAYISQTLNPAERNYEIYDRELLGIIRALTEWRHYLEGSPHPVEVRSDHKNLTYFRTAQKLNRRQARWSLKLSQFDLHLIHVPGTQMIQSDALSRRNGLDDSESDNEDRILLPNALFVRSISPTLFDEIRNHAAKDLIVHEALEAIAHKGPFPMKSSLSDWEVRDGVILYKGKIYVPPSETLRRDLVRLHHDSPAMGHPGKFNTLELLRREFWWPGMYTFVYNYVEGCAACQQMKPNTHPTRIPLEPIPTDPHALPFSCCTTDFITDLPVSNGFDSIMVVVDHDLTKGVILTPCLKTITAEGTAKIFHDKVYSRFGLPDRIISDRGPQYASKVFQELNRLLQIRSSMSTAYHPQTDGETERVNQELEIYLRLYCGNNPETWADRLPDLEFCHNTREHSARKMSPFRIMMGYEPRGLPSVFPTTNIPSVESRLDMLQKIRLEALAMHELARQQMADRVRQGSPKFTLGQKVWLDSRNLKVNYASRKIAPKREGPFEIAEVIGPANYRLKLPKTWRVHSVFHAALLSPYRENDIHGPNYMNPPPDVVDNEEEYEVEAILNHKTYRGHLRQLWNGSLPLIKYVALEHSAFMNMINIAARALDGVTIPNCKCTREEIMDMFKCRLMELQQKLNSDAVQGLVNLMCNTWQASNTDDYFAITDLWVEETGPGLWSVQTALLSFMQLSNAHNKKCLSQALFKIVAQLQITHKMKFVKHIRHEMGKIYDAKRCRIRCLAHIINLAMQAVISTYSKSKHFDPEKLNEDLTAPQVTQHDEIGLIRLICVKKHSLAKCKRLFKDIQVKEDTKNPLQLLLDMLVRWSSILLQCINTFIFKLGCKEKDQSKRKKLDELELSDQEWGHVKSFLDLLAHADNAQQAFSTDQGLTLHLALPTLKALHKAWSSRAECTKYVDFMEALEADIAKIVEYYERFADSETYTIAMRASPYHHHSILILTLRHARSTVLDPSEKINYIRKYWNEDLLKEALEHAEVMVHVHFTSLHTH